VKQVAARIFLPPPAPPLPDGRWNRYEIVFWLLPIAGFFVFPGYHVFGSQIIIAALFAVSLDLILGYARIISLGHAAYFGIGAYTAALLAKNGWNESISGLILAGAAAAILGFLTSFLVVRGQDLTRLMVTLGIGIMLYEAANRASSITGGVDGLGGYTMARLLGIFPFDLGGDTAYVYSVAVLAALFWISRRIVNSPFGLSLRGIREGEQRMPAIGASVTRKLVVIYTGASAMAGLAGGLLAQTTQFVSIETLGINRSADAVIMLIIGGTGRLYGALVGAGVFMILQNYLAGINPVYWQFWLGLLLVLVVLFARGGLLGGLTTLIQRLGQRSS